MCTVYLKNWTNTKWMTGLTIKNLKKLETGLVKQVIARYVSFSQQTYQWIWPILTIVLVIL